MPNNTRKRAERAEEKRVCRLCGWRGIQSQVLTAPNPFEPSAMVLGCPQCREVAAVDVACDVTGCWLPVQCAWSSDDGGVRTTCLKHRM